MTININDIIQIIKMNDMNGKDIQATRMNGKIGTITLIDGIGQLHGTWGGLAVNTDVDQIRKMPAPAFIRKNTPKLREILEARGYENRNPHESSGDAICTIHEEWIPGGGIKAQYMTFKLDSDWIETVAPTLGQTDCGNDEERFVSMLWTKEDIKTARR